MKLLHRKNHSGRYIKRFQQTQAIGSISTKYYRINKMSKFDFTVSKLEKKFAYESDQWGANKKILDVSTNDTNAPKLFGH